MIRRVYHGSDHRIESPLFGAGKPYNDYGLGFYCTEVPDMAREWAVDLDRDGYVNAYDIDCAGLRILDLGSPEFTVLHWLAVLLENRTFNATSPLAAEAKAYLVDRFLPPYRDQDVVIGCRADDSYFSFAQDFINGAISVRQLGNAMRLGRLGEQFVITSEPAFERLSFVSAERASAEVWYPRKSERDRAARRAYFDAERSRRQKGDLYIVQILDEEVAPDDPRLR